MPISRLLDNGLAFYSNFASVLKKEERQNIKAIKLILEGLYFRNTWSNYTQIFSMLITVREGIFIAKTFSIDNMELHMYV